MRILRPFRGQMVKIRPICRFVLFAGVSMALCRPGTLWAKQWVLEPEGEREILSVKVSPDRQELDQARQALAKDQAAKAGKMLDKWLKKFPDSPLRPEALYYAGQSHQQRNHLYEAFEKYEELVKAYNASPYFYRALEAEFTVAERFLGGAKRRVLGVFWVSANDVGVKILEDIAERWPRSLLAERSLMKLGDYYLAERKYADAAFAYEQIIVSYPTSGSVRQARLRAAKAYMSSFKGPVFDAAPLVEAKERLLEYQRLYGQDQHAGEVQSMLAKIEDWLAERDYEVGKFYQRTGKKEAARKSYQQVVQHWPKSQWADKARSKLKKLGA